MMCTFGNSVTFGNSAVGYCVWDVLVGLVFALGIMFFAGYYYANKRGKERQETLNKYG